MDSVAELEPLAVLAQLVLLAVAVSVGHLLKRKRVLWIGGAGAALLLGVLVGVLIRVARTAPLLDSWMVFQSNVFFLVLLPPIMFDACFNLDARLFIKNIGSVCALAFAGTTISTIAVGLTMWAAGWLGLYVELSFLEALTFGALISATDPVTVLAIFQALGADADLYMNVFGESVLNDAVAMVLFQACSNFATKQVPFTAANIAKAVVSFGGIFLGSVVLGVFLGLAAAALLRSRWYHGEATLEAGLMLLLGYASYMAGAAAGISGIVSVMFCAMVCGAYCAPNLSPDGLQACKGVYAVLASCMETFVFVYIGVTLFMEPQEWHCVKFTVVCLFGLAWSRAANVVPCCTAINWLRPQQLAITGRQQLVLWWSGLRGAMAFALAVEAAQLFGEAGKVMKTSTFIVILITVLVNGGSMAHLLSWCGLVQGAVQEPTSAHGASLAGNNQQQQQQQQQPRPLRRSGQQQQQQQQQEGDSNCEQVQQLLLHDKLRNKLQERARFVAAGQEHNQPDELKKPGSSVQLEQQPLKQQQQQQGGPVGKPVVVVSAFAEGTTVAEGMTEGKAGNYSIGSWGAADGVAVIAEAAASLACEARLASPAVLLDETDNTTGSDGVPSVHNLRRRSSYSGTVSASATTDAVAPPTCSAAAAAVGSRPTLLQQLRANGNRLQEQLDHWDAAVLLEWFVNADSALEHVQTGLHHL